MGSKNVKDIEASFSKDLLENRIKELEKEKSVLMAEVEKFKTALTNSASIHNLDVTGISPEQIIAETQLNLLKECALTRQLTLEETKRVEIFHKILASKYLNQKKQPDGGIADEDSEALLKMIQEGK